MAEYRAPVLLTLVVGAAAIAPLWFSRRDASHPVAAQLAAPRGLRLARGLVFVAKSGGLPHSFTIEPGPWDNDSVSVVETPSGRRFAGIAWKDDERPSNAVLYPEEGATSDFNDNMRFGFLAQGFLEDDKVAAALEPGSVVSWSESANGKELLFTVVPRPGSGADAVQMTVSRWDGNATSYSVSRADANRDGDLWERANSREGMAGQSVAFEPDSSNGG